MSELTEMLSSATPEQVKKVGACKTADELFTFAKSENIEITAEQAEAILRMIILPSGELSDEELDNVAGGSDKIEIKCPDCQTINRFPSGAVGLICSKCHRSLS